MLQLSQKAHVSKSLFTKVTGLKSATLYKKTSIQILFHDFCEIFKNTFLTEHIQVTTSVHLQW